MTTRPLLVDALNLFEKQEKMALEKQKEPEIFSVTALSLALKKSVEDNFSFVRLRGEISGFKKASSGHLYFSLKDENAVLDAICWKASASRLDVLPQEGLEVICFGKITTYPSRSKYQIIVEKMEVAGQGALLKLLEERKKKLAQEGLFDASKKKKIPFLPEVIGVITSPTGSVIQDIIHRLQERFPRHVLLWPALMQGKEAALQVEKAIRGFNAIPKQGVQTKDGFLPRPDVLIVARGGGSLEDLFAFNEENIVRAVYDSEIPLISAVGHETDTTLIDYASDLRAPTPTGAAEKVVPVRSELKALLMDTQQRLHHTTYRLLNEQNNLLTSLTRGLPSLSDIVEEGQQKLDDRIERLDNALKTYHLKKSKALQDISTQLTKPDILLEQAKNKLFQTSFPLQSLMKNLIKDKENGLKINSSLLSSFSYERTLERGFALVLTPEGKIIESAEQAKNETELKLKFFDEIIEVEQKNKNGKIVRKKRKTTPLSDPEQGQLL